MTIDQLRSLRDAHPFVPFTIHLPNGRTHRVLHRDFLSLSPSGRTAIVYQGGAGDAFSVIDVLLITELEREPAPEAPAPAAGDAA